jgi:hypothetical protein
VVILDAQTLARLGYGSTATLYYAPDDDARRECGILVRGEARGPVGFGFTDAEAERDLARQLNGHADCEECALPVTDGIDEDVTLDGHVRHRRCVGLEGA